MLGTTYVNQSVDKGESFAPIGSPNTNGFNPNSAVVDALAVNGTTVYAAAGGRIFATTNSGATWADRSSSSLTFDRLGDLYVNPGNANDLYAVRPYFNTGTIGSGGTGNGHVYRTTDGGITWRDISGNLPDEPFTAIKLDKASGTLYVGGDDGVYASSDFGATWLRLGAGLPNVAVVDLTLSNGTGLVAAGTHGRGLWEYPLSTTVAKPNLTFVASVARVSGQVQITITVKNLISPDKTAGNADANSVQINSLTLNGVAADPVNTTTGLPVPGPQALGTISAADQAVSVTFVCRTDVPAGQRKLVLQGTSTQGNFGGTILRIAVP